MVSSAISGPSPIRVGFFYDFPQGDGTFEDAVRLGLAEVADSGRLDREFEFVPQARADCRPGANAKWSRASRRCSTKASRVIIGPAISDNALIVAPLCDAAEIPAINYTGGERTRSQWMFHYQVGSLEEEPPVLAARLVERGLRTAGGAVRSVPGRPAVLRGFEGRALASASRSPVPRASRRCRRTPPSSSRACAPGTRTPSSTSASACLAPGLARSGVLGWDVPVLANSALMFGYARPDWRDG